MNHPRKLAPLTMLVALLGATSLMAQDAPKAKNVILMIADGGGFNQFHLGAYHQYGDYAKLPQTDFPVHCAATTFSVKADAKGYDPETVWDAFNNCQKATDGAVTTDSAAAGTALNTGQKTTNGRISMNGDATADLETIAEAAAKLGKATGAVTSVEISHATPAVVDAHDEVRKNYAAIAQEMIQDSDLDVILGAGHPLDTGKFDYVGGEELWKDLTDGDSVGGGLFIENKTAFERIASARIADAPERLIGVAKAHETINKGTDPADVPTLATMSKAALNVLGKDEDGLLVMIEGGAIDWAGHANDVEAMLRECAQFNDAVQTVIDWVETNSSWDETLLIITADHETGQLWGENSYDDTDGDNRHDAGETFNAFNVPQNKGQGETPGHQFASGSHTNSLVPVWAKGPGSEKLLDRVKGTDKKAAGLWNFSGKYIDNTDIPQVIFESLGE